MSSALTHNTAHVAQGLALLLSKFQGKPRMAAMLTSLLGRIQDLEDALWGLYSGRWLDTAIGAQLDGLGRIVGQARNGQTDDAYRLFLRARIRTNLSTGKVEELIAILLLLLGATTAIKIREVYPKALDIEPVGPFAADPAGVVDQFLHHAKDASTRLDFIYTSGPLSTELMFSSEYGGDGVTTAQSPGSTTGLTGGLFADVRKG